jgi:hypothetical protein
MVARSRLSRSGKGSRKTSRLDKIKMNLKGDIEKAGWKITYDKGFYALEAKNKSGVSVDVWENELNLSLDSKVKAGEFLKEERGLTTEIQKDFDKNYSSQGYGEFMRKWIEGKGWKPLIGGNTYNEDSAFYLGGVYEWQAFSKNPNEDYAFGDGDDGGVVIMWHGGGDVRGNYDDPVVYSGDVESFYGSQSVGDTEENYNFIDKSLVNKIQAFIKLKKSKGEA